MTKPVQPNESGSQLWNLQWSSPCSADPCLLYLALIGGQLSVQRSSWTWLRASSSFRAGTSRVFWWRSWVLPAASRWPSCKTCFISAHSLSPPATGSLRSACWWSPAWARCSCSPALHARLVLRTGQHCTSLAQFGPSYEPRWARCWLSRVPHFYPGKFWLSLYALCYQLRVWWLSSSSALPSRPLPWRRTQSPWDISCIDRSLQQVWLYRPPSLGERNSAAATSL